MEQTKTTLYYVGVAAVLALLAWWALPGRITPDAFLDQGEPFYPDFTDPNDAMSLEVIGFDESTGSARPFKVHFKDGRWTIPSHHDYPADASDRLAQTAAGVIDIKKDDIRSDNVSDHEALGVIDPLDESAPGLKGRGQRITIRGRNDVVLADFIIGKPVEGREDFRYVRLPNQKRTYASKIDVDLSTRFSDWIDTDLLELDKGSITRVAIDDYRINEQTRSVDEIDKISLRKTDGTWSAARMSRNQHVDSLVMDGLLTTLDSLSIVGVRPKPAGLTASLTAGEGVTMQQSDIRSLQSMGYFVTRDGQLLSNEGEIEVWAIDGVVYRLRFGEVLYGAGLSVTAGTGDGDSPEGGEENRYLFLTTTFDQSMLPEPPKPANLNFQQVADSLWSESDRRNKQLQDEHDRWQRRVESGRNRSKQLNDRYAHWYFVISGTDFEMLKRRRSELIVSNS